MLQQYFTVLLTLEVIFCLQCGILLVDLFDILIYFSEFIWVYFSLAFPCMTGEPDRISSVWSLKMAVLITELVRWPEITRDLVEHEVNQSECSYWQTKCKQFTMDETLYSLSLSLVLHFSRSLCLSVCMYDLIDNNIYNIILSCYFTEFFIPLRSVVIS